ncbi:hypothetical protein LTR27_010950 [Elasticomyces elasticus]|nr:hypothetical protein LTR27_010950 [Elasticomyces elasticus]
MFQVSGIMLVASLMTAACLGFLLRHCCERLKLRLPKILKLRSGMPRNPSALLNLPAELRNKIWEEALISKKGPITINKRTWEQPLLLRSCKQIRKEAGPMYYTLNTFAIAHTNLEFKPHARFCQNSAKFGVELPKMTYFEGPIGEARWESLMLGVKAVHGGVIPYEYYHATIGVPAAAAGALQIAGCLKGVDWFRVKTALSMYKFTVERNGTGWSWV